MTQPAFKFELHGLKEIMAAMEQLPTLSMKKAVVVKALKKSGEPIKRAAIENCPYDPRVTKGFEYAKHLKETIKVSTGLKSSQRSGRFDRSVVTVYVGSSSPHAHLVEFGTGPRYDPSGAFRGAMSPNPFFRGAWDSEKGNVLKIIGDELWKALEKAAKLLAKKSAKGTLTAGQRKGLSR